MPRDIVAIALAIVATSATAIAEEARIQFPENYATTFQNYLSLDRVQNPDQIIRLFANDHALSAGSKGSELPYGSVLVGEIYSARKDVDGKVVTSSLGRRIKDKLVAVAVMEKQKGWGDTFPEELKNGDWDFAIFSPDGQRLDKDLNSCRQCHAPLKDSQHVFSIQHLVK